LTANPAKSSIQATERAMTNLTTIELDQISGGMSAGFTPPQSRADIEALLRRLQEASDIEFFASLFGSQRNVAA
jgi:hypothetical protein